MAVLDVAGDRAAERVVQDLPPGAELVPTDWSRDGRTLLAACRAAPGEPMSTCTLTPGDPRPVRTLARSTNVHLYQQRYAPNQNWISFVAVSRADATVSTVYVMPAGGGPWHAVTDGRTYGDKPRWSSDGRTLYYVSNQDGRFEVWGRRFDPGSGTAAGPPFRVTSLEGARQVLSPARGSMDLMLAADRLFLSLYEASGRIWMLDQVDR